MSSIIDFFFHKEAFAAWELLGWWLCGVGVGIKWRQDEKAS